MKRKYLTCAETAKLIRPVLKSTFPGVKFSVRSDTYAGGASIRIRWTDGPTRKEVDRVVSRYAGATFDGMRDLKEYKAPTIMAGPDGELREVSFGANYIFTDRDISLELALKIRDELVETWGEPANLEITAGEHFLRIPSVRVPNACEDFNVLFYRKSCEIAVTSSGELVLPHEEGVA